MSHQTKLRAGLILGVTLGACASILAAAGLPSQVVLIAAVAALGWTFLEATA